MKRNSPKRKRRQMSKDVDFEQRKTLFEDVKRFSRSEQEELYRILKRASEPVSENRNGIFFDMMSLQVSTVTAIQEFVTLSKENRVSFENREKTMHDLRSETSTT
jgi:hypothetical protein